MNWKTKPLTEEEEDLVEKRINEYANSMVPREPHTEEEQLVFKAEDGEGTIIGGCSDEPANIRLYRRMGFTEKIKDCYYDPCGLDENMQPVYEEEGWWLLAKEL